MLWVASRREGLLFVLIMKESRKTPWTKKLRFLLTTLGKP